MNLYSHRHRAHLLAAKGVLRYLAGTLDYGLEYAVPTSSIPLTVTLFSQGCALTNADWASDENDRKSVSGYCFYLHGCLISWSAQKQKVIASSSTEAEYYSLSYALREGLWIRLFLTSLQLPVPTPFPLLCDNQSAIKLANSDTSSSRSKHIDVWYHFIREKIEDGTFITSWIPTADMTADIFTKPLPLPSFSKHCLALGIVPIPWYLALTLYCYLFYSFLFFISIFLSFFSLFFSCPDKMGVCWTYSPILVQTYYIP